MRRFEDRTRWAPMDFLRGLDARPIPYFALSDDEKRIAREVTSVIYRMITHKEPL